MHVLNGPPPPPHRSPPAQGQCWFEFNDTHVSPIMAKQMEKMYQGKQSAYMLFYRKKDMQRPPQGGDCCGLNIIIFPFILLHSVRQQIVWCS